MKRVLNTPERYGWSCSLHGRNAIGILITRRYLLRAGLLGLVACSREVKNDDILAMAPGIDLCGVARVSLSGSVWFLARKANSNAEYFGIGTPVLVVVSSQLGALKTSILSLDTTDLGIVAVAPARLFGGSPVVNGDYIAIQLAMFEEGQYRLRGVQLFYPRGDGQMGRGRTLNARGLERIGKFVYNSEFSQFQALAFEAIRNDWVLVSWDGESMEEIVSLGLASDENDIVQLNDLDGSGGISFVLTQSGYSLVSAVLANGASQTWTAYPAPEIIRALQSHKFLWFASESVDGQLICLVEFDVSCALVLGLCLDDAGMLSVSGLRASVPIGEGQVILDCGISSHGLLVLLANKRTRSVTWALVELSGRVRTGVVTVPIDWDVPELRACQLNFEEILIFDTSPLTVEDDPLWSKKSWRNWVSRVLVVRSD